MSGSRAGMPVQSFVHAPGEQLVQPVLLRLHLQQFTDPLVPDITAHRTLLLYTKPILHRTMPCVPEFSRIRVYYLINAYAG